MAERNGNICAFDLFCFRKGKSVVQRLMNHKCTSATEMFAYTHPTVLFTVVSLQIWWHFKSPWFCSRRNHYGIPRHWWMRKRLRDFSNSWRLYHRRLSLSKERLFSSPLLLINDDTLCCRQVFSAFPTSLILLMLNQHSHGRRFLFDLYLISTLSNDSQIINM